jgi:hypothetical protein
MARNKNKTARRPRTGSMLDDALFFDPRISELSKEAFILLIEAVMIFNNHNNSNIALAEGTLRFKWRKQTLIKARKELVDLSFIYLEQRGFYGAPNLYSLCHRPLNDRNGNQITTKVRKSAAGIHPKNRNGGTEAQLLRGAQV